MLKLSTKGRYGVRLMFDLALHNGQGPVSLRDIATRQSISEKYLWHLIPPLRDAGLIRSSRGVRGGYVLAHPPSQISLKDILDVLEGRICLVDCVANPSLCPRSRDCIPKDIWRDVSQTISRTFDSFTLEKMIEKQRSVQEAINYAI
ncbi:MAG: Rrf2 family transcriptional regulator [Candidatus Aureabacteria bacterium]|nr:Rrf2 family transcriptional regulator [Candidatus Auribacterota bacterium]